MLTEAELLELSKCVKQIHKSPPIQSLIPKEEFAKIIKKHEHILESKTVDK